MIMLLKYALKMLILIQKRLFYILNLYQGVALCHLVSFRDTIEMFDVALQIDPNQADIYNNKGKNLS